MDHILTDTQIIENLFLVQYIESLNEKELKAYNIARDHLGMSFCLEKSIGFLNWKKDREQNIGSIDHP